MSAYLSFEWLKLWKRWMPRITLVLLLGLLVFGFWAQSSENQAHDNLTLPRAWLTALVFSSFFAPFFWPVLGGSWAGNEYGWGTIRMVLTRRPYRSAHIAGALAILLLGLGIALACVVLVGSAAGAVVGALTGTSAFVSGVLSGDFVVTLLKTFLSAWYVAAFYLILSYVAATIFRSAAVGIGIGIGSTLAEFILRGIFVRLGGTWKTVAEHFPVVYTTDLASRVASRGLVPGLGPSYDPASPGVVESLIALGICMTLLLAVMIVVVRARDVTA